MAKLRKGVAYRRLERPYTRYSKYRKNSYIRGSPQNKIVKFDMGNLKKEFKTSVDLIAGDSIQIRQEAIESARRTCNRHLERKVGKQNFYMKIRMYPFHILRENPLAKGAGADRFSTGMSHAFGNPIGRAAQVKTGKVMFSVYTNPEQVVQTKLALKKAAHKMPCKCFIQVRENK
ncbi:50S ribosomal protein L16 [Candidatus Woesearchaeota archaeon]|nr:50S ribosomal protein L16 [Candidatus Woesearchaeota archaeon]